MMGKKNSFGGWMTNKREKELECEGVEIQL
jgi:hypothetical protein